MRSAIIIGDLHLPWGDTKVVSKIYDAIEEIKPRVIVQIGDLYDLFSFTRFSKSANLITPQQELLEGREFAEKFWGHCQKRSPKASCYQILGNHDVRPKARALEKFPEIASLMQKGWEDLYKFPGVDTVWDYRDDLIIDGVVYEHGFYGRPGQHCKENMKSTVIGHTHRPWIHWERVREYAFFELNVGYAADPTAEPLSYPRKKYTRWLQGYGVIEGGVPRFVPVR